MAHQITIKEIVNGVEITETIDSNILISVLSYNAKPFFRSTNEEDIESFQIIDRIGEIYHLPALATEFTLIDINNNYFIPANGEELIEYSYKIRIFRPENEFDKVLNVGTVEATTNTVKVNIPSVGLPNSVLINGSVYENYYPSLFNFVAVVEFTKILIVYAKPDSTVFYLAQGVEALSAVEPDYDGLFVARIIASIDGNIIEYPNYGVITEDSDTVAFTGNGTAGNPLSAKGYNGSYSTTETLTGGTWIDGKPIYRKVIEGLLGTLGESSVEFIGADAIDVVISKFIYTRGNNGLSDIEFAEDGFTHLAVRYDNINQSFNIISKPDKAGNTYYLTVEYTKISDVAP